MQREFSNIASSKCMLSRWMASHRGIIISHPDAHFLARHPPFSYRFPLHLHSYRLDILIDPADISNMRETTFFTSCIKLQSTSAIFV